ncbi:elongation factor G [Clostridiales bacterium COT073_COT-073]|nr:elongation factor G [Clostridiales bacterium COT073_COT-073]
MKIYATENIRNIALLGHGNSGKTTLAEAMAYVSGLTKRQGNVADGNTISDFDKEEIKRKISISASLIPIEWKNNKFNILDTPGYFDFAGEAKQAVRVADSAIIVINGKSGVEVGTEKAWEYAEEMNVAKMIYVSGMDDEHANLSKVLEQLKEIFGKSIAPIQVPIYENEKFVGFVNVAKMEARRFVNNKVETAPIPEGMDDLIAPAREMILEAVAETDEVLMEKYFNGEEFTLEEIQEAIHKGVMERTLVPVLCGDSIKTTGVTVLLNAIEKYLPNPVEENPTVKATDLATKEEIDVACDPKDPVSTFVFKTIVDPYVGRISLFRVYSGTIKKEAALYNSRQGNTEKITRLYTLSGKEQVEVDELHAGDIGAFVKLENVKVGDTLCSEKRKVRFKGVDYPESLAYRAIKPKSKGDEDKIGAGLARLMEEDPTIKLVLDKENRQELLYGVGGQHLEIIVSKLASKYNVQVELANPKIPYRETIRKKVQVQGRHKKQSGGHGQFGDVIMVFEPSGNQEVPFEFFEEVFGGSVPKNYFPAVEKGLEESVQTGILAGYPVVGIKATLIDGSYHPVDSSEMAFKIATTIAFKEAMKQANPVLLEPIAKVKVTVPDEYMGDIMGDMTKRRGRILGMTPVKGKQEVEAEVPYAELYEYSTDLRSMTQGRGLYTLAFERYQEAPKEVQDKVIQEREKEKGKE